MGFWRKKVVQEDEDIMRDDEVAVPSLAKRPPAVDPSSRSNGTSVHP